MTFEQKLKAAALEAALHPAQKAKLYDAVYPMLQEADREHLFALLEHAAGLCE